MQAGNGSHAFDHLVGVICCREGAIAEGISFLERALSAAPANIGYKLILARALVELGRFSEALTLAAPAQGTSPGDFALMQVAAEAADALGDAATSARCYRRLTQAHPNDWRLWSNLGASLAAQDQWPDAVAAFERAAALAPDEAMIARALAAALASGDRAEDAAVVLAALVEREPGNLEARLALAALHVQLDRPERALEQFEAADKLDPGQPEIALGRSRNLVALARFEEAKAVLRQLLNDAPATPTAVHELGLILERTSRLEELATLLGTAREAGIDEAALGYLSAALAMRQGRHREALAALDLGSPDTDPARWHRMRAKIADALGDPAQAFASASAMNLAVADFDQWRERGAEYRSRLRQMAAIVTPEWCARLPRAVPPERPAPAFLVGFPRSGTTLLDTFIMGHPATHVVEEGHMLGAADLVVGGLAALPDCSIETIAQARAAYFAELDRHVDPGFTGLVIDKLPLNMLGGPLIQTLFPDARIIFSQRHPCDAVLSGFMQSFVLNDAMACFLDLEDAADLYDAAMAMWTQSHAGVPLTVHTLAYESLVRDPEGEIRPLLEFLGLQWADRVLDHRATAAARGPVSTPSYDQITQPLNSRPSGRWRDYRAEMAPVLPQLLKWAKRFGYPD